MDKARLYQNGKVGPRVFAREIDSEPWWRQQKTPLICPFCKTAVVSQRTSVGRSPRAALFRLAADKRHEDICPLNPAEVLEKIARGSQGVAVIEGDELHLVLPDDLGQIGAALPPVGGNALDPDDAVGVNVSTVRPLLPPLGIIELTQQGHQVCFALRHAPILADQQRTSPSRHHAFKFSRSDDFQPARGAGWHHRSGSGG